VNVIEVSGLIKRYKELVALDNFNLSIQAGEIFGLLGPNGSGKTTAINCILQLLTYDKGELRVLDQEISPTSYDIKRRIGIVPQNIAVFPQLNVTENIDYFCSLYISDKAKRRDLVEEAIHLVGLEDFRRFRPRKLSGGLIRRLNIACGIAHKPELIFFDEPTVAVDPQSRNAILEGIRRLNEQGSTVVYTSHYMEEVEQLCTRIMIMDHGQALATGTNMELKKLVGINERIEIELLEGLDAAPDPSQVATLTPPSPAFEHALELVRELPHTVTAKLDGNTLRVSCARSRSALNEILEVLNHSSITYGRVYSEPPTLNDVFLEITGKELRD
jgi:ABC-2 type transport system ATP-binding protein